MSGKNDPKQKQQQQQQQQHHSNHGTHHHYHHQRMQGQRQYHFSAPTTTTTTVVTASAIVVVFFVLITTQNYNYIYNYYDTSHQSQQPNLPLAATPQQSPASSCQMRPHRFRTNNLINPLAIEDDQPVFSWALELRERGEQSHPNSDSSHPINHYQTAYRIICKLLQPPTHEEEEEEAAVILWDSGKVTSRETLQIEYDGIPLESLQRVEWQVQIWDQNDQECVTQGQEGSIEWPFFETGLLREESWQDAEWIARYNLEEDSAASKSFDANASLCDMMNLTFPSNQSPRFRTQLQLLEEYETIRAYIVGLGYYQLYINGQRVGDAQLDPGWTTYNRRVYYSAYNITDHFLLSSSGRDHNFHTVAVELGNGWWNPIPLNLWNNPKVNIRHNLVAEQGFTSTQPMFKLQIFGFRRKKKQDGSVAVESILKTTTSSSNNQWYATGSPTLFNNIFLGEIYDTRLESLYKDWKTTYTPTTTDGQEGGEILWKPAVSANHQAHGQLGIVQAQPIPPIRRQREALTTKLLSIHPPPKHGDDDTKNDLVAVYDTGVNHAGNCRIRLFAAPNNDDYEGKRLHLMYGELLYRNGTVNGMTSVVGQIKPYQKPKSAGVCQPDTAYQQDVIILGGKRGGSRDDDDRQVLVDWTPSWSWHGFRYIQVTLPQSVDPYKDLKMDCYKMRTDMDLVTTNFETSDPWLTNVLRPLVQNTFDSNLMSVLSDCPHRERFGYGGDALGAGEAGLSIYDWSSFLRKRVLDYNDAQRTRTGNSRSLHRNNDDPNNIELTGFTETSPYTGIADRGLGYNTGPIGWQSFQPEALLWLYKYYGDLKTMKQSFPHTKAYIDLLDSAEAAGGIQNGLGDWMPVDMTDVNYTGLGFQRMSYLAFANITDVLGMSPSFAAKYRQKATEITKQINRRFLVSDEGKATSITRMIQSWLFRSRKNSGGQIGDYRVETIKQKTNAKEEDVEVQTTVVRTGNITQTGQAMALFNGFLDEDPEHHQQHLKRQVLRRLVENVHASSYIDGACRCDINTSSFQPECEQARGGPGPHMTAGLFGIKWFLMALADGGQNDLAYEVVTTKSYPGLRWMTNNPFTNATTIWESYFVSDDTYSHNHPMFGSTEVWLLQSVVGIQPHPAARGMDHVLIRPNPPSQLDHASASFQSPRGIISVSWRKTLKQTNDHHGATWIFKLEVTIPPNCQATVHVPASFRTDRRLQVLLNGKITDGGRWVSSSALPSSRDHDDRHHHDGSFVISIGSGHHQFESELIVFGTAESAEQ